MVLNGWPNNEYTVESQVKCVLPSNKKVSEESMGRERERGKKEGP